LLSDQLDANRRGNYLSFTYLSAQTDDAEAAKRKTAAPAHVAATASAA
jgi:hypothetical protein